MSTWTPSLDTASKPGKATIPWRAASSAKPRAVRTHQWSAIPISAIPRSLQAMTIASL